MKWKFFFVTLLILSINSVSSAQWSQDFSMNLPICIQSGDQTDPLIVSDGSQGAIIVWADKRDGDIDLYAQRVTQDGQKLWQEDGIPIHANRGDILSHRIIENGNGGAYITWIINDRIYAQQIDSDGQLIWSQPIRISSLTKIQHSYYMTSDLNGGFVMSLISGSERYWNEIIAQRVNSNGDLMWGESGKIVISHSNSRTPKIASTSNGGAFIFYKIGWVDYDNYLQILDQNGNKILSGDGIHVGLHHGVYEIISDGFDGAITTWEYDYEIFANRINKSGNKMWGENGIIVCEASTEKVAPRIISDNNHGAYIAWYDAVSIYSDNDDIYAQHLDSTGQRLWDSDGILVIKSEQQKCFWYFTLQTNNQNDLICSWETNPNDRYYNENLSDFVWVQKISPSGDVTWTDGLKISTNPAQKHSISTTSDNQGGIIAVWVDKRHGNQDIYAQRVDSSIVTNIENKNVERRPNSLNLYQNYPNPFTSETTIKYFLAKPDNVSLKIFNIAGQEIETLVNGYRYAGANEVKWPAGGMPGGIYFYTLQVGDFVETKKMVLSGNIK